MNNEKIYEFKAKIQNCRFKKEDYKIYKVEVNEEDYPDINKNKNDEYIIVGDMYDLVPYVEYNIKAIKELKKYGYQYKVKNIRRDKPTDKKTSKKFLTEILTYKEADTLLKVYPDIIDKIIKNNLSDIDLSLTKGIKEKKFEKIKTKVMKNFCLIDLVDLFEGNLSMSIIKKLYDKFSSIETIKMKISENPYNCLCDLSRIGFETADKILINLEESFNNNNYNNKFNFCEDLKKSYMRMEYCIFYILEKNEKEKGNTKIDLKKVRNICVKLVPECINHFVKVIKNSKELLYDKDLKTLCLKKTYETERYIGEKIFYMLKQSKNNRWNINYELYREDGNISLTDEQLNTLKNICKYNVSILTAPAGAGKSQSIKMVVNMLEDNNKTYLLTTPTGKSSEVLGDYVNRDSGTIHRQLDYNPQEQSPWGYNEKNKLKKDVIIIDEFGMVDIFLMKHLLEAIDFKNTKILLVFDSYQLSSVGCGNIAHDLLTSGIIPITLLTKIFRYDEGGLMQIATKIRNSEYFLPDDFKGVKIFGSKKDYIYIERPQNYIIKEILKIYKKMLNDKISINDIMILTSQNKGDYGTRNINNYIQKLIQKNKDSNYIQRGNVKFYKGDKVIQIMNNYKAEDVYGEETHIYNGNTGIIIDIGYNEMIVDFGKKQIVYTKTNLEQLELGYCLTIHKSQGDSCKNIILVTPKAHCFMLTSNLLYVGNTRGKKRVYHIGNVVTINRAIKIKQNLQRDTYLKQILINLKKNN